MSNIFWKNVQLCFPSLKCLPTIAPSPPSKHDQDHSSASSSSTASTTLLIKNFDSLYDLSSSDFSTSKSLSHSTEDYFSCSTSSDSEPDMTTSPPDFATIFASQRLFFSSPGRSKSIIESPESSIPDTQEAPLSGAGVAVKKYSPNPYMDFRRSMQEMIEARNLKDVTSDWDFLHELLLCYLKLNPKHTHKFIISAFADLLICLLSSSDSSDSHRKHEGRRRLH